MSESSDLISSNQNYEDRAEVSNAYNRKLGDLATHPRHPKNWMQDYIEF